MKLLLLPGYACTPAIWEPFCGALPHGWRVERVAWPRALTTRAMRIEDFSDWLDENFRISAFDAILGHSLGGLVALHLPARAAGRPALILVESFLAPPGAFFQNLLCGGPQSPFYDSVTRMLAGEGPAYLAALHDQLRAVDFRDAWPGALRPALAIYGDRGSGDPAAVQRALGWPPAWSAQIPVEIVAGACHFPMLENPEALAGIVRQFARNAPREDAVPL